MKILDNLEIKNLGLTPKDYIKWTKEIFSIKGECELVPKIRMGLNPERYMVMPAIIPNLDLAGVKFISRNVDNYDALPVRNSTTLLQKRTKAGTYAIVESSYLTTMRTGAVAAYSTILAQKPDSKTIGIVGLGVAARAFFYSWLYLISNTHMVVKLYKYKDQAESFVNIFKSYDNIDFEIVQDIEDICSCDIVVSAISYARDLICPDNSAYSEGCTVVPIHTGGFQNCDLFFDKILVDDIGHVKKYRYYEQFKDKIVEIEEVVNSKKEIRNNDKDRVLIYAGGIALTDIYFAYKAIEYAGDKVRTVRTNGLEERFFI